MRNIYVFFLFCFALIFFSHFFHYYFCFALFDLVFFFQITFRFVCIFLVENRTRNSSAKISSTHFQFFFCSFSINFFSPDFFLRCFRYNMFPWNSKKKGRKKNFIDEKKSCQVTQNVTPFIGTISNTICTSIQNVSMIEIVMRVRIIWKTKRIRN